MVECKGPRPGHSRLVLSCRSSLLFCLGVLFKYLVASYSSELGGKQGQREVDVA